MYYPRKQNRLKKIVLSITGALVLGNSGCYVTGEDILGSGLQVLNASGAVTNSTTRHIISKGSDLSFKAGSRRAKHQSEIKEADVDIYRERGLSKVRVDEEKAFRDLENRVYTNNETPKVNQETQEALASVLGRRKRGVDTNAIVQAVTEEFKKHPYDLERNIEMIANTYELDNLSFNNKTKLNQLMKIMFLGTRGVIFRELWLMYPREEIRKLNNPIKQSVNKLKRDTTEKLKIDEFMFNQMDNLSDRKFRTILILQYDKTVNAHTQKLSNQEAVELTREKIEFLESLKDNVSLTKDESDSIYLARLSGIGALEGLLRRKLEKTDPEFKTKEQEFKDTIRDAKMTLLRNSGELQIRKELAQKRLTQREFAILAEETGYTTELRRNIGIKEFYSLMSPRQEVTITQQKQIIVPIEKPIEIPKEKIQKPKKSPYKDEYQRKSCKRYIESSLKRGTEEQKIKQVLKNSGFTQEQINFSFEEAKN